MSWVITDAHNQRNAVAVTFNSFRLHATETYEIIILWNILSTLIVYVKPENQSFVWYLKIIKLSAERG